MSFKISKFFLYAAVFCIAIVTTSTLFPFIVGKYFWFRTAVDLALVFFLIGLIREMDAENYAVRFKKAISSPIGIAVSVFTLAFLLAGAFGVNPHNSFWSNFERGEGGIQMIHLYMFFLLLSTLFSEAKQWLAIFKCFFATALLSIGYGLLAGWGVDGFIGPTFGTQGYRFAGSIGNPAYLATYLIFVLFYAFYTALSSSEKGWKKKIFPLATALVSLIFLVFTATRGAFLGLTASILVFLGYLAFSKKEWRKWMMPLFVAGVAFIAAMALLKNNPVVQRLPFARLFDLSASSQTFSDRRIIWKMAWDGFKERPVFGVGPENFLYVFDHNFNTNYFQPPAPFGAWFDRAHSIIFDYLVETGLLGAISFFSIFLVIYFQFWRKNRAPADSEKGAASHLSLLPAPAKALIFALPVAYFVQGLVLFDILPTYINLFLFFAFSYYLMERANPITTKTHE